MSDRGNGQPSSAQWIAAIVEPAGVAKLAIAVEDEDILASRDKIARGFGMLLCPEGAAAHAAWKKSLREGLVDRGDRIVIFNCATGLKYPLPPSGQRLDANKPVDFALLRRQAASRL